MKLWRMGNFLVKLLMVMIMVLNLTGCTEKAVSQEVFGKLAARPKITGQISEVAPPVVIQELRHFLEVHQPQVSIITPQSEEVLSDNTVKVRLQVKDLPIFKNPQLDLGPHLQVILDNQPYINVYDLNQPVTFSDLTPGTHTLRIFASLPWGESFKNVGAYSQLKFHVFTKTEDTSPDFSLPLLTYSLPQGSYGAEPILLDFYLNNAPLSILAQENPEDSMADWRIRCTINGESFVLDRWQSVYLQGFKPGKNWIKLEFIDRQGNPVINVLNTTTRTITYDSQDKDTLAKMFRGELSLEKLRGIVDPKYTVKVSEPKITPEVKPTPEPQPTPTKPPVPQQTPTAIPQAEATSQPAPQVTPAPAVKATPPPQQTPQAIPQTEAKSQPAPQITPTPAAEVTPPPPVIPQAEAKSQPAPPATSTVVPTPEKTSATVSPEPSIFQKSTESDSLTQSP
jgi:hypothetical protein